MKTMLIWHNYSTEKYERWTYHDSSLIRTCRKWKPDHPCYAEILQLTQMFFYLYNMSVVSSSATDW